MRIVKVIFAPWDDDVEYVEVIKVLRVPTDDLHKVSEDINDHLWRYANYHKLRVVKIVSVRTKV